MKITAVKVLDHEYDLCYSTRVAMKIEQNNIKIDTFSGSAFLLSALMEAGDTYAKKNGQPGKGFLTVDEIADSLSPHDLEEISPKIAEVTSSNQVLTRKKKENK